MDWEVLAKSWILDEQAMEATHAPILEALLRDAAMQPGERVVDIGCGMGATLVPAVQAVGPDGHVAGLDIAGPMVARASERLAAHPNVDLLLGDAATHRFAPGSADLVLSLFGLMFFDDPGAAFANIATALRPGGRIVFAAWGPGPQNPWFSAPRAVALERFPGLAAPDPASPGPLAFGDADRVVRLLEGAGLVVAQPRDLTTPLTPPGSPRNAAEMLMRIGPLARLVAERGGGSDDIATLTDALTERFATHDGPDGLLIPALVRLFSATKPG